MAKRRTRKQKESAKHTFTVEWDTPITNSQDNKPVERKPTKNKGKSNSMSLQSMVSIKKDLIKSLLVFVVIISALVAYSIVR